MCCRSLFFSRVVLKIYTKNQDGEKKNDPLQPDKHHSFQLSTHVAWLLSTTRMFAALATIATCLNKRGKLSKSCASGIGVKEVHLAKVEKGQTESHVFHESRYDFHYSLQNRPSRPLESYGPQSKRSRGGIVYNS